MTPSFQRELPRIFALCTACLIQAAQASPVEMEFNDLTLNGNLEQSATWPEGPVLLITHGTLSHNRSEIISGLQTTLLDNDISSLAINLSLAIDDRTGPYDCTIPHRHRHEVAAEEIGQWVSWLESRGVEEIYPAGHSRGANQTAWFSTVNQGNPVAGLVLIAPPAWDSEVVARDFAASNPVPLAEKLQLASAADEAALMPVENFLYCSDAQVSAGTFISYYSDDERKDTPTLLRKPELRPTLLLLGSDDPVSPPGIYLDAASSLSPAVDARVIDGADHFFRDLFLDEAVDYIVEFIESRK